MVGYDSSIPYYWLVFGLEGHGLGTHMQVGKDVIVGCGEHIFLSEALVLVLQELGICTLYQINDVRTTSI
jgi:hypothetical protein